MDPYLNLLIVITLICWGSTGIFDKKAVESAPALDVIFTMYFFTVPMVPIMYMVLAHFQPGFHLSPEVLLWTALSTIAYTIALPSYLCAMSKTEASYVLGITASYPLILQLLAAVFLDEKLVVSRLIGALLIGAGVGAIGGSITPAQRKLSRRDKLLVCMFIVLATLGWGVWGLFDKKALLVASPLEVFFVQRVWSTLIWLGLGLVFLSRGYRVSWKNARLWKYCTLSEICLGLGGWTFLNALSASSASYVIAITGCYPLLMYSLALWLLKEKFNRVRFAGIFLVVIGGILVQITQSI